MTQLLTAAQHLIVHNSLHPHSCICVSWDFRYVTIPILQVRKLGVVEESDMTRVTQTWAWAQSHTRFQALSLSVQPGPLLGTGGGGGEGH